MRVIRRWHGRMRIAGGRADEREIIVSQRKVRTEHDRLLELGDGLVMTPAQP